MMQELLQEKTLPFVAFLATQARAQSCWPSGFIRPTAKTKPLLHSQSRTLSNVPFCNRRDMQIRFPNLSVKGTACLRLAILAILSPNAFRVFSRSCSITVKVAGTPNVGLMVAVSGPYCSQQRLLCTPD